MYADDFSIIQKTGKTISDYLLKSIEDTGPSNALEIVTDNAKNYQVVGKEIEKICKHIFWSPCVCHSLNLIKDFANALLWLRDTYKVGKKKS